jgi:hypothetical protein
MIPRNDPPGAGTAPVLDERQSEGRGAKTAEAIPHAGNGSYFPTGRGWTGRRRWSVAEEKSDAAVFSRGKREPPRRPEIGPRTVIPQLGDDRHRRATFQRLLHGPESVLGAEHPQVEDPLRRKPNEVETGAVKPAGFGDREFLLNPQRLPAALAQRCKRQRKTCGGAEVHRRARRQFV